jgi:hypothetical protein
MISIGGIGNASVAFLQRRGQPRDLQQNQRLGYLLKASITYTASLTEKVHAKAIIYLRIYIKLLTSTNLPKTETVNNSNAKGVA